MAISDKLTYLNDTKTQLKDMINYGLDTGEKITSETTFRNYAKSLFDAFIKTMTYPDVLYNNLPKVTGEGTSITLNNTVYAPMKIDLSPSALEQETTTGANLINRAICDEDKGLVWARGDTFSDTNSLVSNYIKVEANESLSFNYKAQVLFYDSSQNYLGALKISSGSATIIVGTGTYENQITIPNVADVYYMRLGFRTSQNDNIDMTAVDIMVNKGSSLLPYEEYTGGIASPNPDYPQQIHTVSGENSVLIRHINMWNEDWEQGYYNSSGVKVGSTGTAIRSKDYIPVRPNTNYYYYNGTNSLGRMCYYDKNKIFISSESNSNVIRTTPENCYYITISTSTTYGSTYNNNICVNISNTNINGTYYPHKEQTYPISLGDLEYCKIGDYEDEFYKATESDTGLTAGKWYLKKNVGKVVLNGSETGWDMGTGTNVFMNTNIFNNTYLVQNAYSNYFKNIVNENITGTGTANNNLQNNEFSFRWGTKDRIYIKTDIVSTIADFKTWLGTHNTTVYYVLSTPTYTLLSETLQTQLDNIQKAISYQDQTNVSQTNNDLPFVIKLSAIRDLSGIFELIQG